MSIASHNVEALSPEAFAPVARHPFPCAPGYGRELLMVSDPLKRKPLGAHCAFAKESKVLRCFKGRSLTTRSCFYLSERQFSLEPANMISLLNVLLNDSDGSTHNRKPCPFSFIPGLKAQGFLKRIL